MVNVLMFHSLDIIFINVSYPYSLSSYFFLISFINSFILNNNIAPLQENYSEALPTPTRLKRAFTRMLTYSKLKYIINYCSFIYV